MLKNFGNGLSLAEMKNIKGGLAAGTCGYKTSSGSIACGVSLATAQGAVSGGGNWCCDSCATSSYCGGGGSGSGSGSGSGGGDFECNHTRGNCQHH